MMDTTVRGVVLYDDDPETAAEIVANAPQAGFTVPVALGGDAFSLQPDGAPAVGRVENLRAVGGKVVGDLTSLPRKVYHRLRMGLGRIRTSIYERYTHGGQHIGRTLQKVTLLDTRLNPQSLSDFAPMFGRAGNAIAFGGASGPVREFTLRFQVAEEPEPAAGDSESPHLSALLDKLDELVDAGSLTGALQIARKLVAFLEGLHGASSIVTRPPVPRKAPPPAEIKALSRLVRNRLNFDQDGGLAQKDAVLALTFAHELEAGLSATTFATSRGGVTVGTTIGDTVLKDLLAQHKAAMDGEDYDTAATLLQKIQARKAALGRIGRSTTLSRTGGRQDSIPADAEEVSAEVAHRVREYMAKHPAVTDMGVALKFVLADDKVLKSAYLNDRRSADVRRFVDAPSVQRVAQDTLMLEFRRLLKEGMDPLEAADKARRAVSDEVRREYTAVTVR